MPALTSRMTFNGCAENKALLKGLILLSLMTTLLACSVNGSVPVSELPQPPSERINHHWVSEGETLYAIAWRYDIDPMTLARTNGLANPFTVFEGQKLSLLLEMTPSAVAALKKSKRELTAEPKRERKPTAMTVAPQLKSNPSSLGSWYWPANGRLSKRFTQAKNAAHKGIDISGRYGQPVSSANNGIVVYSGSGLPAYGKLLIIKHSDSYLSAYAHNSRLFVSIGAKVQAGEKIAEIGKSGTTHDHLHFEIRKNGKPINPLSLLPKK